MEGKLEILFVKRKHSRSWDGEVGCCWRSEGQGEGSVAEIGEDIHPAAVACSCQHLEARGG